MVMFLRITDKYAIESDSNSWAVSEKRYSKRDGEAYKQIAWYNTLNDAINGLARRMIRVSDANNLQDAIKHVEEVSYILAKALEPKFKLNKE